MNAEDKRQKTILLTRDYLDENGYTPSKGDVNLMSNGYFSRRYGTWAVFLKTELGITTENAESLPLNIEVCCQSCGKKKLIRRCNYKRSKTKRFFCDSACAARFNNAVHIKRKKKVKSCVDCGTEIRGSERCTDCHALFIRNKYDSSTLKDFIYQSGANKYNAIRYHARRIGKENGMNYCAVCGYDKHVQICHIIPISEFDEDDLMIVVNSPRNLLPLCPNHHWEFDNGVVSEDDIVHKFTGHGN